MCCTQQESCSIYSGLGWHSNTQPTSLVSHQGNKFNNKLAWILQYWGLEDQALEMSLHGTYPHTGPPHPLWCSKAETKLQMSSIRNRAKRCTTFVKTLVKTSPVCLSQFHLLSSSKPRQLFLMCTPELHATGNWWVTTLFSSGEVGAQSTK